MRTGALVHPHHDGYPVFQGRLAKHGEVIVHLVGPPNGGTLREQFGVPGLGNCVIPSGHAEYPGGIATEPCFGKHDQFGPQRRCLGNMGGCPSQ
ncbi:hypothetical protein D3C86_1875410 [compost metagenome]